MKKLAVVSGFVPEGTIKYSGQYVYKVKAYREGEHGLGPDFPQPEFLELELEGKGGINGKIEKTISVSPEHPLDCRNHKYYLLEHDVWIKNLGDAKYVSDWTGAEVWALLEERTYDEAGNVTATRELGFIIVHSDRKAGYVL